MIHGDELGVTEEPQETPGDPPRGPLIDPYGIDGKGPTETHDALGGMWDLEDGWRAVVVDGALVVDNKPAVDVARRNRQADPLLQYLCLPEKQLKLLVDYIAVNSCIQESQ